MSIIDQDELMEDEGITHVDLKVTSGFITLESGLTLQLPKGTFTITKETLADLLALNERKA